MKKSSLILLLTMVSIYGAEQHLDSEETFFAGIGNAPTIQLPQLASSQQTASSSIFTNVTTLDLSREPNLDAARVDTIATLYPNLEELTIVYGEANSYQHASLTREFAQALVNSFPNLRLLTLVNMTMHWAEEDAESILQNWQKAQTGRKLDLQIIRKELFIPGPESGFSFRERLLMDPYANIYRN